MAIWYPGLRFLPTDKELFFHYLMRRMNHEPLPDPCPIRDCDLYDGGEPWKIFDGDREEKFYVFTMLKKKDKSRVDRSAGSGTWRGEQNYKIKDQHGHVVGYKKLFTFEPKHSSNAKADKAKYGHWIMYEYSKHPHKDTECVLCVISNKCAGEGSKKVRRNPHGGVQLEEDDPRAKKARPSPNDHTNAVDVSFTASPPSSTAATQARPSASPAFNRDEVAIPQNDMCYAIDSLALHGDGKAISLIPPTAANMVEDTCPAATLAFGGANAGSLPTTSTVTGIDYCEWADRLKKTALSPNVRYLFAKVVEQRALHARSDLGEGVPANWRQ